MECFNVRKWLSAYHDRELPSKLRASVTEHVARCRDCDRDLVFFSKLTALAARLIYPVPPTRLWKRIEGRLDEDLSSARLESQGRCSPKGATLAALAAVIVVSLGTGTIACRIWDFYGEDYRLAVNFGDYLSNYQRDPQTAQQALLTSYEGQAADLQDATRRLGYRPMIADGVPPGYSLESLHVLEMPCCLCALASYRRETGGLVTVMEHDKDQPNWFRGRPSITTRCGGVMIRMVQVDDQIAATWRNQQRYVTVIGTRDVEEVQHLATHFGAAALDD